MESLQEVKIKSTNFVKKNNGNLKKFYRIGKVIG